MKGMLVKWWNNVLRGNGKYRAAVMGAVAVLCICAVALGMRAGSVATAGELRDLPIYSVKRDDKVISISFDAAWGDVRVRQFCNGIAMEKAQLPSRLK